MLTDLFHYKYQPLFLTIGFNNYALVVFGSLMHYNTIKQS